MTLANLIPAAFPLAVIATILAITARNRRSKPDDLMAVADAVQADDFTLWAVEMRAGR